ncbi:MAG: hypothetical protein WBO45_20655 [Planctomycetota bacterium]
MAFTANVGGLVSSQGYGWVSASVTAVLDFLLMPVPPVAGIGSLRIQAGGSANMPSTAPVMQLDIGADGSVEATASTSGTTVTSLIVNVPATGLVVRVQWQAGLALLVQDNQGMGASLQVQYFPGQPAVGSFSTVGASSVLAVNQGMNTVTLSMGGGGHAPLVMAFGFQPVVVPLLPTVTQLVSLDSVFAIGSITLSLPVLPSGAALYAQGLVADTWGTLRSTNSVRALWP